MPDRSVSTRDPIAPRSTGDVVNNSGISTRLPITRDAAGRGVIYGGIATTPPSDYTELNARIVANAAKTIDVPWSPYRQGAQAGVTSPSDPGAPYRNTDPLLTLSDVFRNLLGGDGDSGISKQTGQALVPVTSSSGGGNSIILIIVVIAIAGGAYYYYKKRKAA